MVYDELFTIRLQFSLRAETIIIKNCCLFGNICNIQKLVFLFAAQMISKFHNVHSVYISFFSKWQPSDINMYGKLYRVPYE